MNMDYLNRTAKLMMAFALIVVVGGCSPGPGLPAGVDVNEIYDNDRYDQFAKAAYEGDIKLIEGWNLREFDINRKGKMGMTPLWIAYYGREIDAFRLLMTRGASADVYDQSGEPMIGVMIHQKDFRFLEAALSLGADPNIRNYVSEEPVIFRALTNNEKDGVKLLLEHGANINATMKDGTTPITYASNSRQVHLVEYLLDNGADPLLRNELDVDIAAGLFGPNWVNTGSLAETRQRIIERLELKGYRFNWSLIERANVANLAQATGAEPVKWFKGETDLNPEWVKAHPEEAAEWYRTFKPTIVKESARDN